eukprot:11075500-Alexandrium_andersonii.AAC.1
MRLGMGERGGAASGDFVDECGVHWSVGGGHDVLLIVGCCGGILRMSCFFKRWEAEGARQT